MTGETLLRGCSPVMTRERPDVAVPVPDEFVAVMTTCIRLLMSSPVGS